MKKACDNLSNGFPGHSLPITLRICADSRRDNCCYYMPIEINTKDISFRQGFCGYEFRKEEK